MDFDEPHRDGVVERIDWSKRADYVRARHQVEPSWATEAVNDPVAYWLHP